VSQDNDALSQPAENQVETDEATELAEVALDQSQDADETSKSRSSRLENEGEVAADYLEEFLDIVDMDGDIDIDVDHGRAVVAVVSEESSGGELKKLVGRDGEVLDALQELTRIAIQNRTGDRSRLMLDVAGYRAGRREQLQQVADQIITEVKTKGVHLSLEPMNAFERKVVHDRVAEAGLVSESSGVDPERFVVVRPA